MRLNKIQIVAGVPRPVQDLFKKHQNNPKMCLNRYSMTELGENGDGFVTESFARWLDNLKEESNLIIFFQDYVGRTHTMFTSLIKICWYDEKLKGKPDGRPLLHVSVDDYVCCRRGFLDAKNIIAGAVVNRTDKVGAYGDRTGEIFCYLYNKLS